MLDRPRLKLFRNLTEIYARSTEIESVEPRILQYLVRLRRLDLSGNKIRHLSVDLRRPLESLPKFESLFVDGNPLVCDCHLIWLKEFLKSREPNGLSERTRRIRCEINKESIRKNLVLETKVIYINSTYKENGNYFKLTSINHVNNGKIFLILWV